MPETTTADEVLARRSAIEPDGGGKVVISTMRKRRRVTFEPVLFVTRFRRESVPNCELFAGSDVKSRTRFGETDEDFVRSSRSKPKRLLRWIGLDRFSGPGAPSFWPAPMSVPLVST